MAAGKLPCAADVEQGHRRHGAECEPGVVALGIVPVEGGREAREIERVARHPAPDPGQRIAGEEKPDAGRELA